VLAGKHETTLKRLAANPANRCAWLKVAAVSVRGNVCDQQCQVIKTEQLHENVAKHDIASFWFSCGSWTSPVTLLLALYLCPVQHMQCSIERQFGRSCTSTALTAASRRGDDIQQHHHKGILRWC
jgi:hypothetical protein